MLSLRQKGFNLIELMIGLTILAMLLAFGAPSFSQFLQNRKIRTAADAVVAGLGLAKSEAVRRNTRINFALDSTGGWTVGCDAVVGTDCPATIQSRPAGEAGSSISTTAVNVTFNGYGVITSLAAGTNATINISNPLGVCEADATNGTMRCLRVVVTPGGQIRMCDPKMTSTNPSSPLAC